MVYNEVCFAHFILEGSGGMHPQEILDPLKSLLCFFKHCVVLCCVCMKLTMH